MGIPGTREWNNHCIKFWWVFCSVGILSSGDSVQWVFRVVINIYNLQFILLYEDGKLTPISCRSNSFVHIFRAYGKEYVSNNTKNYIMVLI